MANDIQITVGVAGGQDVLKLANAITTLGNNSEKLAKQLEGGRLENSAFVKGLSQQISALTKLGVSTSDATKFIMGNAQATRESIEAAKESKAANEAWLTTQKKMETAWALAIQKEKELAQVEKDLVASRAKLDAAAKQEANTLDQLKSKYQAGYAEMKLYKAENEQLNLAYKKNIITADQLRIEQEQLNASFAKGTGVFGVHMNQMQSSASRMGVVYQQAGYQAGDFFVQVQSGTSILTAFSQQATQMVGMMYLIPQAGMAAIIPLKLLGMTASITMAQLTLGLSIAIPIITSLASLFITMSNSNSKANETAKDSVNVFKELAEATRQLNTESMKRADPKFDENLIGTQDELEKLTDAYEKAKREVESYNTVSNIGTPMGVKEGLAAAEFFAVLGESSAKSALEKAEADLKAYEIAKNRLLIAETQATIDEQNGKQRIIDQEKNFEQIVAESAARTQMEESVARYANSRTVDYQNQVILINQVAEQVALVESGMSQSAVDALLFAGVDLSKGVSSAAKEAASLAASMNIALSDAYSLMNLRSSEVYSGRGSDPRKFMAGGSESYSSNFKPFVAPKEDKSSGAVAGRIDTQEEYLAKLAREYDMKKKSLGLTDDQIKRTQFLFTLDEKIATMKTKRTELEIETERKRAIAAYDAYVAAERQDALMGVVNSNINDAFMAMVDGSATVADAFRNMMFNILKSVYEQNITQPAANAITDLLKGFLGGASGGGGTGSFGLPKPFGSANGNVFSNGSHVTAYANGGVVGSPTTFSMSGGKTGLMGEAGPEAIMPLKRGSNGQLGVQVNGNAGGMTVNNNITVTGSDAAAVRMEVAKMIPQITNATKAAIIDAKRRGGQMGAAFQ